MTEEINRKRHCCNRKLEDTARSKKQQVYFKGKIIICDEVKVTRYVAKGTEQYDECRQLNLYVK